MAICPMCLSLIGPNCHRKNHGFLCSSCFVRAFGPNSARYVSADKIGLETKEELETESEYNYNTVIDRIEQSATEYALQNGLYDMTDTEWESFASLYVLLCAVIIMSMPDRWNGVSSNE